MQKSIFNLSLKSNLSKLQKHQSENKLIIVIGLGKSGIGAAKLLNSEGKEIIIMEQYKSDEYIAIAKELNHLGIKVKLGLPFKIESLEPWINDISSIIISPGIDWDHVTVQKLREIGIKVSSEINLSWQRLNHIPWIGITGTNGKTTVTHMINHILKSNNIFAPMAGNMGNAVSNLALKYKNNQEIKPDYIITELSSYQLETARDITPKIGIFTNLTPDHLDRHKTMRNYFDIKNNLLIKSSERIFNADDSYLRSQKDNLKKGIWISTKKNYFEDPSIHFWINTKGIIMEKENELFNSSILSIPGDHNIQNLLMAIAAARITGLTSKDIEKSLTSFSGVPHRIEIIKEFNGMKIFNDSKATNFESSTMALKSVLSPTILIAGGKLKIGDPSSWLKEINKKTTAVLLFGSAANKLKEIIKASGYNNEIQVHYNLNEAILAAKLIDAKSLLFSPACSSFDQYRNFEERGNHFKNLIKQNYD